MKVQHSDDLAGSIGTLLGIFARFWEPGQVKTRLAATVGAECAATVQRMFLQTLLRRFAAIAEARLLLATPDDRQAAFRELASADWEIAPQGAGNLGQRMQRYFELGLHRARRVVLIGSDSPDLPAEYLERAFEALQTYDVVLGPAADGGYYLVGTTRYAPPIFDGIDWGTSAVWQQTTDRLRSAGIAWHELSGWYDVDDSRGLHALLQNVNRGGCKDLHLLSLEKQLRDLLGSDELR